MGVKIAELIPRKQIEFDDLKNKRIAIDAKNMLYQFVTSIRQRDGTPLMDSKKRVTSHLVGCFSRLVNLMSRGIKISVVYDGKMPLLKIKELEEREHRKRIAEKKLKIAMEEEDIGDMYKYSKQATRITREMINESKELIRALGLPVIQAPNEADAQAAFMCERKDVDYVASSDMDCLVYGAPKLITNLTLSQRRRLPSGAVVSIKPEVIELKNVLNTLKIDQDHLIVLAILIGTDYNIGGVKGIGPKNALRLIKEYKNFDDLFKAVKADFNWKQIYAIYKSMPIMKNYKLKWGGVDEDKIKEILIEEHDFSKERVEKTLSSLSGKKDKNQSGLNKWV